MIKNVVYNFAFSYYFVYYYSYNFESFFISKLSIDWLMTSFCLQKVKKMYEGDYVSKRKLTLRTVLKLTCLSKHHISQ